MMLKPWAAAVRTMACDRTTDCVDQGARLGSSAIKHSQVRPRAMPGRRRPQIAPVSVEDEMMRHAGVRQGSAARSVWYLAMSPGFDHGRLIIYAALAGLLALGI